jgi:hypothetical protein
MEGKIPMVARRYVPNKLRTAYTKAKKADKTKDPESGDGCNRYRALKHPQHADWWFPTQSNPTEKTRLIKEGLDPRASGMTLDHYSSRSGLLWVFPAESISP